MYSIKLGVRWIIDAATTAPVPLRIAVILPDRRSLTELLDTGGGVNEQLTDLCVTHTHELQYLRTVFPDGTSFMYFVGNHMDHIRGRQFDYIWVAGAGRLSLATLESLRFQLPITLRPRKGVEGDFNENVLVTY